MWHKNERFPIDFDKEFGTHISQEYKFPFGYSADEVWRFLGNITGHNENLKINKTKEGDILRKIFANLDERFFPYKDIDKLSFYDRFSILSGMASGFNVDDIIWFSIRHVRGADNIYNQKLNILPREIRRMLQWVISPQTFEKLKKVFGEAYGLS
jgi:hypothetical protein